MNHRVFTMCLLSARRGNPHSQLEVAKIFLNQHENYLEAYAWAEVASCHDFNWEAEKLKTQAFAKLKSEEIQTAFTIARDYKERFLK